VKLEGRVAIVTGGSRGIGAAICRRFGKEGARVAVVGHRNLDLAKAVAGEIVKAGGSARAFKADVAKPAQCERLAGQVAEAFGPAEILVNNAGIFRWASVEDTTEENWDAQHDLNLKGAFFMTKAVVPAMKKKRYGKVLNITSIAGVGGFPNAAAYCATKGGLEIMTKALCLELAQFGINVNSLAPGNIKTDMNAPLRAADRSYDKNQAALTPSHTGHLEPEDLVGAAVYLCSDDAAQTHGATLLVDGGWAAW
jgi:NAD(P)-dependent dehydrogenase (short-subunit alcohol dehydrogenase family)